MASEFGKTWWGKEFLNALSNIDWSNRLARGSRYARNGSVLDIEIINNEVLARVQGSRPKPYKIEITFPTFKKNKLDDFIAELSAKPVIISKLLHGDLDPEILNIAFHHDLKVFPHTWEDLDMECSCPDFAVPCKHLAAVIYKLSTVIDNDPFMAFKLHDVDLESLFQKHGVMIQDSRVSIDTLADLHPGQEGKLEPFIAKKISLPDYSKLPDIGTSLLQLLTDAPVFYPLKGNFKEKYATFFIRMMRNARSVLEGKHDLAQYGVKLSNMIDFIDPHLEWHYLDINENHDAFTITLGHKQDIYLEDWMMALWNIPNSQLDNYHPSVILVKEALHLTVHLIAIGAIVPKLIKSSEKEFAILWLPAMLSKEVASIIETIDTHGFILFNQKKITARTTELLISALLKILIPLFAEGEKDDYSELFFENKNHDFAKPGEQSIPQGIYQWVQPFYFTQQKYIPRLKIKEHAKNNFSIEIHLFDREDRIQEEIALEDVLAKKKYADTRFDILQSVSRLSGFIPGLDLHINEGAKQAIIMNIAVFTPFLLNMIPVIQLLGVQVLLPKSLQSILRPKASVQIKKSSEKSSGLLRLDHLLDFHWQVAIGDSVMDQKEFERLLKKSEGLIKTKAGYIYVDQKDLEHLHHHFNKQESLTTFDKLKIALSEDYKGSMASVTDDVKALIRQFTQIKEIAVPKEIQADLRPYQWRGYSWLYKNTQVGFGSILADDMGLGKTLQVITTIQKFKDEGILKESKILVIVPTGLLTNWQTELTRFAPTIMYKVHHGGNRTLDHKENYDVLLTTYGVMRSDADQLKKMKWYIVIADEAQNIKNANTIQSKAIKSIPAHTFIAMSGTPVENRLSEMWSIVDFTNRGYLGSANDFKKSYSNPIQNSNDVALANRLKTITSPILLRRLKSDKSIIDDLPDKIEMDCFSVLVKEQAVLYEKTLQKAMKDIEEIKSKDHQSLFKRQGLVLQLILALKQICNHPSLFLKNKQMEVGLSGKMDLLLDKIESILEANEKVLVFTQFAEMGHLLEYFIQERFNQTPMFIHGGCSVKQRKDIVDNFQNRSADKILLLSLKAAGTGLNLTAANHVIHYDLWWNPAVEAQATDRAYRIGQSKNVMVHRFITKNTFEEKINDMIQHKKRLANMTVATGENWIGNMSNTELKELFRIGS
ncbi:MAG: SNF2-related protein [Saprospiraceae bacterium]